MAIKSNADGNAVKVFFGAIATFSELDKDKELERSVITDLFTSEEEAYDAVWNAANQHRADFGEFDVFQVRTAYKSDDIEMLAKESELVDNITSVGYNYKSINNALLVRWSWGQFDENTGRCCCRVFHGLTRGCYGDTERECIDSKMVNVVQLSVIATADELIGLSIDEQIELAKCELLYGDFDFNASQQMEIEDYLEANSDYKELFY